MPITFLSSYPLPHSTHFSLLYPILTSLLPPIPPSLPSSPSLPSLPLLSSSPRFQASLEVEGSGGGLLECFPCTSNQQLVNRTCKLSHVSVMCGTDINRTCTDTEAPTDESIGMSMWVRYKCLNLEMTGEETLDKCVHSINLYGAMKVHTFYISGTDLPPESVYLRTVLTATLVPAYAVLLLLIVSAVIVIVYVWRRWRRQRRSVTFKPMDKVEMSTNQTEAGLVHVQSLQTFSS